MLNPLSTLPFMMRIYSHADLPSKKVLKCVSQSWSQLPDFLKYKECVETRFRLLAEALGLKFYPCFEHVLSKEHLQAEAQYLTLSLFANAWKNEGQKNKGASQAILPLELEHPISALVQKASFSNLSVESVDKLQSICNESKDSMRLSLIGESKLNLQIKQADKALLLLDIAQQRNIIEPVLKELLSQLAYDGDSESAHTIFKAIAFHPDPALKEIHKEYLAIFNEMDEQLKYFNKQVDEAGEDFDYTVYEELKKNAVAMPSMKAQNQAISSLLRAVKNREWKVYEWIDELEEILGLEYEEGEFLSEDYSEDNIEIDGYGDLSDAEDSSLIETIQLPSVFQLMSFTPKEWSHRKFSDINARMQLFCSRYEPIQYCPIESRQRYEKLTMEVGDSVAVIGDLHGHGLRLDLTLKALRSLGYLDASYRCLPGKNIVFLGDYMDRGSNNLKVLELVIALKMENPENVFLVRGNHEDISQNAMVYYTSRKVDAHYRNFMADAKNTKILQTFYEFLPASVYLGQRNPETSIYQYAQYCHGLFYMYNDPIPLLASSEPHFSTFNHFTRFSSRLEFIDDTKFQEENLSEIDLKKVEAKKQLVNLSKMVKPRIDDLYWFDVGPDLAYLETGRAVITPAYAKAYLRLCSTQDIKITEIFRGHQKGDVWLAGSPNGKKFITTIDPSENNDEQNFIIMTVTPKIKNYKRSLVTIPLQEDHLKALSEINLTEITDQE